MQGIASGPMALRTLKSPSWVGSSHRWAHGMLIKGEALMGGHEELREDMGRQGEGDERGTPVCLPPQKAASGFSCSFGLALSLGL